MVLYANSSSQLFKPHQAIGTAIKKAIATKIKNSLQSNRLNVSYAEIEAPHGHDSFLLDIEDYTQVMIAYLNRIAKECETGNG